MPLRSSSW
jgi:hypothetical protein